MNTFIRQRQKADKMCTDKYKQHPFFSLMFLFCGIADGISSSSCFGKSLAVWTHFHQVLL